MRKRQRDLANDLKDLARLLGLLLFPNKNTVTQIYDLISTKYLMGEKSLYLNLGYWHDAQTYDQACEALACLLAESAGIKKGDLILDAGFGFADQDMYWIEAFELQKIVGLNVVRSQVERARRRVSQRGLEDQIDLRVGSATSMPIADASFDKVLSLEAAMHFVTREDFLAEAYRVLRPGGRLTISEMVRRSNYRPNLKNRLCIYITHSLFQMAHENFYSWDLYRKKLANIGYTNITMRSIREKVFVPFSRFFRTRLRDPEVAKSMNPFIRPLLLLAYQGDISQVPWDYLIVTADKPC